MSTVHVKNNAAGEGPVLAPLHEDGSSYPYCLYFNSDAEVAFADSIEELLDMLLPGYLNADDAARDLMRIQLAQSVAGQIQAEILFDVDRADVSDHDWAILNAPRQLPQPDAGWWSNEIPLVVVETAYAPYTAVPRPASAIADGLADAPNLWWIRPAEDEDFLISLHEVGYVRLLMNTITSD